MAAVLAEDDDLIRDFRVMKKYSHGATKVFDGGDRWCLTGDAGVFLDPLYSSGLDLVAIGNGLITDMIVRELDGEDVVGRAQISDSLFRSLAEMWLAIYQDQYTLMGTPNVMSAKIVWDVAFYWGFVGLLYTNGRFVSVADDPGVVPYLEGLIAMSNRVQRFFREWAAVESGTASVPFVDLYSPLNFMVTLHTAMMGPSANFAEQFDLNTRLLRQLAGQLIETILSEKSSMFGDDDAMRQVQDWQRDSLLHELRSAYRQQQPSNPVSAAWIVATSPVLQIQLIMGTDRGGHEPLAIVGIGCRLPGGADSAKGLWTLLCSDIDATCVVPETRWNADRYHDPNPAKVGKIVTRRGGFLSEIDQFDPQFFGISPREAHSLDPQQRLLLHAAWEALEDGGIPADGLAGTDVGVFIGGFTLDYQLLQNQGRTSRYRFKSHSATGMMMTMLANRISHAFDFRGPSMTVDTACSGSLVAVHLAAQSIWHGECDLALAGGVNIMIGPNTAIAESKSGFLSTEGRSKAFDDSADGYARGEGGAVVVIKSLEKALGDGDEIYAQILGTAVSQDGHTDGITVPREEAQEAAIRAALRRACVDPTEVGYVEAHGTGTPLGDPIEMRALSSALTLDRQATNPLLIGSVKTNIGHLEAGAGVAGLIKGALVAKHGYIPANLHLRNPNRLVSLEDLKIDVPATGRPFPAYERRVVGVNSFGFGGTNAHVVLAEPPAPADIAVADRAAACADHPADLGPLRRGAGGERRSACRASDRES